MESESKRAGKPREEARYLKGWSGECGNDILAWKFLYTSASDVHDGGVFALVCFAAVGRKSQPHTQKHICTLAFE